MLISGKPVSLNPTLTGLPLVILFLMVSVLFCSELFDVLVFMLLERRALSPSSSRVAAAGCSGPLLQNKQSELRMCSDFERFANLLYVK